MEEESVVLSLSLIWPVCFSDRRDRPDETKRQARCCVLAIPFSHFESLDRTQHINRAKGTVATLSSPLDEIVLE
jgi:hypothetical protein